MIDYSLAEEDPHYCRLPDVYVTEDGDFATLRRAHPIGTRFHCDECAAVWVLGPSPSDWMTTEARWRRETRRQRRQRLGLRWWQRER